MNIDKTSNRKFNLNIVKIKDKIIKYDTAIINNTNFKKAIKENAVKTVTIEGII